LTRFVTLVRTLKHLYDTLTSYSLTVPGYIPHLFSFGGHITSEENACSLKFRHWYGICYGFAGCWLTPIPFSDRVPTIRFGTAIEVGPPRRSPGKIITFPFVSDIYANHKEDVVGAWALGLGFTPFPLFLINDVLKVITLPNPIVGCQVRPAFPGEWCYDNFRIDCSASGETVRGNPIYKVILKIGTAIDPAYRLINGIR
jgi:hypothetical protein